MKFYSNKSGRVRALIVVPKMEREKVFKAFHDSDASGHMSFHSTLHNIRSKYYWPKMATETKHYCEICDICFRNNQAYRRKPKCPLMSFLSGYPNQCIAIDLFGPFVKKKNTYKYILTIMCRYTRFLQAAPLITATSQEIAQALLENWFFRWGIPDALLSDQGANLVTSELMKELYQLLNIDKRQTTAYRPQTNGLIERKHRDIANVIRKLVGDSPANWKDKLPVAVFAINMAVCRTTGYAPYHLMLSYNIRGPSDLIFDTTTSTYYQSQHHLRSINFQRFRDIFDQVRSNITDSLEIQKRTYDRQTNFTKYKVGDLVLLYRPLPPTTKEYKKFLNKFSGPHEITKVISDNNYMIKLRTNGKEVVVHYDHLRFYKPAATIEKGPITKKNVTQDMSEENGEVLDSTICSPSKGKEKATKKKENDDIEDEEGTGLNYIGPFKLSRKNQLFSTRYGTPVAHRTRGKQRTGEVVSDRGQVESVSPEPIQREGKDGAQMREGADSTTEEMEPQEDVLQNAGMQNTLESQGVEGVQTQEDQEAATSSSTLNRNEDLLTTPPREELETLPRFSNRIRNREVRFKEK